MKPIYHKIKNILDRYSYKYKLYSSVFAYFYNVSCVKQYFWYYSIPDIILRIIIFQYGVLR